MAAKQVALSTDDATYRLLPGGTGEITREGVAIEDTIFGQTYKSEITGPITWGMNANAIYKGYPGYVGTLKQAGTPVTAATEACTIVSGKTYQIDAVAKRIWDRTVAVVVFDNAVDHTADVDTIDYLFGMVTFDASYSVTGPVTVTVDYLPMISLGKFTGFTLNMTADAIRDSDIPALIANGGFHTHIPGLKTVTLEVPTVFDATDDWPAGLEARAEYLLELNPDGLGEAAGSLARGFFRLTSQRQSGDVGALEEESLMFSLNVPYLDSPGLTTPFGWIHDAASPMPLAIQDALTRWAGDLSIWGRYLHDGIVGWKGSGVITNISLSAGMEAMNVFTCNLQMSGAATDV